jgi:manganese-dependent inorganic pyrophosphatase
MTKDNIVSFELEDKVDEVRDITAKIRYRAFPIVDENQNYVGIFSRRNLLESRKKQVILVDHNEKSQAVNNVEDAEILEIIDHHRLGSLETISPVYFRNQPLGCTSTIIYQMYQEKGVVITKDIAGLLCAAIISDTLYFNSPTCTSQDIEMAKYLAGIAEVDLDSFALQVLAASASIKEKTIEEIVYNDLKIFEIEKYKVALGQINIMSIDDILPIREQIQEYLDNFTKSNNFGICVMIFSVVDGSGSYLISSGSALFIADAAFADIGEHCDGYLFLKEVMSRKKQIVPLLTEAAKNYRSNYHA